MPMVKGISIATYTVLAPNSGPIRINPMISSTTLIIRDITDIGNGIKLLSTIARADPLPIATWLGSIKKYIATAERSAPKVIIRYSFILRFIIYIFPSQKKQYAISSLRHDHTTIYYINFQPVCQGLLIIVMKRSYIT